MDEMTILLVSIDGFSDSTHVTMAVNEEGLKAIILLAQLSHRASEYECMPTISLKHDSLTWSEETPWIIQEVGAKEPIGSVLAGN